MTRAAFLPALRLFTRTALAALVVATPGLALAQAVTYSGTLGKSDILLEVSSPIEAGEASLAGRYSYVAQGADIPLQPIKIAPGKAELGEEKPCTAAICDLAYEDVKKPAPIADKWYLATTDDGATLTGEWRSTDGKVLPIALKRAGTREFAEDADLSPAGLATFADELLYGGADLTMETSPYDFLRVQTKLTESPETVWGDVAFNYVTDPRTKFAYPAIKRLTPGGNADEAAAANAFLTARHQAMSLSALDCKAEVYQGFGWMDFPSQGGLASYDEETVTVDYLSPRVMAWTEAGSLYCTGAHPYNHADPYVIDVVTGKPFDMSLIFKDWIANDPNGEPGAAMDLETARASRDDYSWGANDKLVEYVKANRVKSGPDYDADMDAECGIDGLISGYLSISFAEGDKAVFNLTGLASAYSGCGGTVLEVPLADIKDLLTPEAAEYFPSLNAAK